MSFTSSRGTTGLITPSPGATLIETIAAGQGVPLSTTMGANVRLFCEAQGADRKTRIFTIDSVDGYVGQDFNAGSSTTCSTTADYSVGGGCQLTVAVGLAGDSVSPNSRIQNARQNKIGFPVLIPGNLPFLGPKNLIYSDGAVSGLADRVDFEDWEGQSNARHIDDFHFLAPTGSMDLQVMYLAITNGTETPFASAAILLKP